MRAIRLHRHGGIEELTFETDVPKPQIGTEDVLVRVRATSVNRIDFFVRSGYPGIEFQFPHIPGADIAGEVAQVGSSVKEFVIGDRVVVWPLIACGDCEFCTSGRCGLCANWQYFGMHVPGSYAEYVRVPAASLIKLPDEVSFEDAATLPVAGLTAHHGLKNVAELKPGQSVLIWGGSGGLGTFAVQIAKFLRAKVITTVGSDEKRAPVEALGADLVLNHHTDDVLSAAREFTSGAGLDVVFDSVGAQTFPIGFQLLKKGGKLLLCGKMTGLDVELSIHMTYLRHVSILGLYLGEKEELEELLDWVAQKKIKPVIDQTLSLEQAAEAQRVLAEGARIGKVVMLP